MDQLEITRSTDQWWKAFAGEALPNVRPGTTQYLEMRKAFYSGLHQMLCAVSESADVDLDHGMFIAYLTRRREEIDAFYEPGGGLYEEVKK